MGLFRRFLASILDFIVAPYLATAGTEVLVGPSSSTADGGGGFFGFLVFVMAYSSVRDTNNKYA